MSESYRLLCDVRGKEKCGRLYVCDVCSQPAPNGYGMVYEVVFVKCGDEHIEGRDMIKGYKRPKQYCESCFTAEFGGL